MTKHKIAIILTITFFIFVVALAIFSLISSLLIIFPQLHENRILMNFPFVQEANAVSTSLIIIPSSDITATIQWAVPELRTGPSGTNDDTDFYIAFYSPAEDGQAAIFKLDTLLSTSTDGTHSSRIELPGLNAGTYDVIFKGSQTLSKKLNDIEIVSGQNVLNFTTLDNSSSKGSEVMLGGDISNAGTTPDTLGDNVINSIDISVLLNDLDSADPTGNSLRANINQDTSVNSVDMSIILKNLDVEGDHS